MTSIPAPDDNARNCFRPGECDREADMEPVARSELHLRPPMAWIGSADARRVRLPPDAFSLADRPSDGTRCSSESHALARDELSRVVGPVPPLVERYWEALSYAPTEHLRLLRRTGGLILFAPSITEALSLPVVGKRRGRPLTGMELAWYRSQEWAQAGVYEPRTHVLAFPTRYRRPDLERVALHELGHALTWRQVAPWAAEREDLLEDLPPEIAGHVSQPDYVIPGDPAATIALRVLEVIADGYLWLIAGRGGELTSQLRTEVLHALAEAEAFALTAPRSTDETR